MPTEAKSDDTNFLAIIPEHRPELVLTISENRDKLIEHVENEVKERTFDLSTATGRDECRSFAAKITRTKTTIDKTAKELTEDWRTKTAVVNAERKILVERLDTLAKQARQPLTDWEDAEEKRVATCEAIIAALNADAVVSIEATAADVEARIARVKDIDIPPEQFQGMAEFAEKAKARTLEFLDLALERLNREEADRAELVRLREAEEQRKKEDAERIAAEEAARAAERRAAEETEAREEAARRAEEARQREEVAAREREAAAVEAERQRAAREAEEAAAAREREHEAALAAEREAREAEARRQREEEERQAQAARAEEARQAEAARAAAERARIEADQEHRKLCKKEAEQAIMAAGITESKAKAIVLMIIANEVPRVTLDFAAAPAPHLSSRAVFDEVAEEEPAAPVPVELDL